MKRLIGEPGDNPRAAPIRALRSIFLPLGGDDEAAIQAALLAEIDRQTKGQGRMSNAIWLAGALRAAGCNVVELAGWETRGRPGGFGPVEGVLCHHTAGARTGNAPSRNLIVNGRPDLAGPLSHLHLARDGTFTVIAAGRCNHAGPGSWQGVSSGNTNFIGIEAENVGDGSDPWPDVQMEAYAKGAAAILSHVGAGAIMCVGHKEYALPPGRKIDPSFNMVAFRQKVAAFMGAPA